MKLIKRKISLEIPKFYGVVIILTLFIPSVVISLDDEFIGADTKKIREVPEYLKICHQKDKKIDKCIKSSLEKFLNSVNSGLTQLNLPSIDPIKIPFIDFRQGSGNVSLHIAFKDFTVLGFSRFKILSVKSNLIDNKFEISMETPFMNIIAQYSAEGGIYTFPISGQGDFHLNLTQVSTVVILHLTRTTDLPGLRYFAVEECLVDLLPSDINGYFGEFIDGSNVIGSAFNTFFNNNAHEIFTVIKPNLSRILANIFGSIANEILSRHPDDVLLPL